jgi:hypothetical protein
MRFVPTRVHGMLDYLVGALLVIVPLVVSSPGSGARFWVPAALGAGAIVYALATDYELGVVRLLPMPAHLALDALSGVLLAASPWLFGFADRVRAPHLLAGLFEIAAAAVTRTTPSGERAGTVGAGVRGT